MLSVIPEKSTLPTRLVLACNVLELVAVLNSGILQGGDSSPGSLLVSPPDECG